MLHSPRPAQVGALDLGNRVHESANDYIVDPFATPKPNDRPIVVTYMHMTKSDKPMPPTPVYECDELGVILDGELTIEDESGTVGKFSPRDSFFVKRGSKITFGSESNALVVKVAGRYADWLLTRYVPTR
jgi:ethanolamine utilization protein EutQ (cupin superfamily)